MAIAAANIPPCIWFPASAKPPRGWCLGGQSAAKAAAKEIEGIRYYAIAEGGHVSEVPQTLRVNLLPAVAGRQPDKMIVQMWDGYLGRMDDLELRNAVVEGMVRSGVNEMRLRPEGSGMRKFQLIGFAGWNVSCIPWLEEHPDDALLKHNGKRAHDPNDRRSNHICTTQLLGDTPAWNYVEGAVATWMKERDPDHVNWDYEHDTFSSYISCYCPRCLDAFGEFASIPNATGLTPATIKTKHGDAWTRFMLQRFADLARQQGLPVPWKARAAQT